MRPMRYRFSRPSAGDDPPVPLTPPILQYTLPQSRQDSGSTGRRGSTHVPEAPQPLFTCRTRRVPRSNAGGQGESRGYSSVTVPRDLPTEELLSPDASAADRSTPQHPVNHDDRENFPGAPRGPTHPSSSTSDKNPPARPITAPRRLSSVRAEPGRPVPAVNDHHLARAKPVGGLTAAEASLRGTTKLSRAFLGLEAGARCGLSPCEWRRLEASTTWQGGRAGLLR